MTSKRVFFILIGLMAALAFAFVGVMVFGNKILQERSKKLVELKLENAMLEQQQVALVQANKDIERYAELEKIAKAVVPQDKDQAKAVREIIQLAEKHGIAIRSITFPASTLGQKAAPAPKAEGEDNAAQKPAAPPITQAKPVEGITGVYALEMNIIPDDSRPITYYQFLDFLSSLENNRRTAQVTQIRIDPKSRSRTNPLISFSLTINIFIKP